MEEEISGRICSESLQRFFYEARFRMRHLIAGISIVKDPFVAANGNKQSFSSAGSGLQYTQNHTRK
ncbi:MAG: hypothetical protein JWM11_3716 [Planctomycetaceae bacterium]|nr:hypothetical protein [Planctomycetaceae bacterium]